MINFLEKNNESTTPYKINPPASLHTAGMQASSVYIC